MRGVADSPYHWYAESVTPSDSKDGRSTNKSRKLQMLGTFKSIAKLECKGGVVKKMQIPITGLWLMCLPLFRLLILPVLNQEAKCCKLFASPIIFMFLWGSPQMAERQLYVCRCSSRFNALWKREMCLQHFTYVQESSINFALLSGNGNIYFLKMAKECPSPGPRPYTTLPILPSSLIHTANEGPVRMPGSHLCNPRNETVISKTEL